MKYSIDQLIDMSKVLPEVEHTESDEDYVVRPIQAGGKYHVTFKGGQEHFLYIAPKGITLFCHNVYLPAIHAIKSATRTEVNEIYLRANAVVFSDEGCLGDFMITPISAVADIIWGRLTEDELYKHFQKQYHDLYMKHPKRFKDQWTHMPNKELPGVIL